MALKSTIFKAELHIADLDQNYYGSHALTIAQHPSETDERMMLRLLAFALNASETLEFGRGISDEDEPALWQRSLTGEVERWIDLGQPDEKRLKKAANTAGEAVVYAYGARGAEVWWQGVSSQAARHGNLKVYAIEADTMTALAGLTERTMQLHVTIQEGAITVSSEAGSVEVALKALQ